MATAPEQAHGFVPHVTIAYSHVEADAAPYAAALAAVVTPAVTVPITDFALIRQECQLARLALPLTTEATAPLGSASRRAGPARTWDPMSRGRMTEFSVPRGPHSLPQTISGDHQDGSGPICRTALTPPERTVRAYDGKP